jgi:hypothetical protein
MILSSAQQERDRGARIEQTSGITWVSSHSCPNAMHREVCALVTRPKVDRAGKPQPTQMSFAHNISFCRFSGNRAIAAPRVHGSSTIDAGWTRLIPRTALSSSRSASVPCVAPVLLKSSNHVFPHCGIPLHYASISVVPCCDPTVSVSHPLLLSPDYECGSAFSARRQSSWVLRPTCPFPSSPPLLPQGFHRLQRCFPRHLECTEEAFVRAVGELKASEQAAISRA